VILEIWRKFLCHFRLFPLAGTPIQITKELPTAFSLAFAQFALHPSCNNNRFSAFFKLVVLPPITKHQWQHQVNSALNSFWKLKAKLKKSLTRQERVCLFAINYKEHSLCWSAHILLRATDKVVLLKQARDEAEKEVSEYRAKRTREFEEYSRKVSIY
jgi:hypothetical protein